MEWVKLLGNDDERPVYTHLDELHPSSRIRGIFVHDRPDVLRVNCSRDMIRSLVASQRHLRPLCQGQTNFDELLLELERDCVTLVPNTSFQCAEEAPVWALANHLVLAMKNWPLLNHSFNAHLRGMSTEWLAGPLHCHIQFANKPSLDKNNRRPMQDMIYLVLCQLLKTKSFEEARQTNVDEKLLQSWNGDIYGPFWWITIDTGKRNHQNLIDGIVNNHDDDWNKQFLKSVSRHHSKIPDISRVFRYGTRPFEILKITMAKYGYGLSESPECVPLILPTMWKVDNYVNRGQKLLLQIQRANTLS